MSILHSIYVHSRVCLFHRYVSVVYFVLCKFLLYIYGLWIDVCMKCLYICKWVHIYKCGHQKSIIISLLFRFFFFFFAFFHIIFKWEYFLCFFYWSRFPLSENATILFYDRDKIIKKQMILETNTSFPIQYTYVSIQNSKHLLNIFLKQEPILCIWNFGSQTNTTKPNWIQTIIV